MSSIRLGYVGFGLVLAAAGVTAIGACSSSAASGPPGDNGGAFITGTGATTGSGGFTGSGATGNGGVVGGGGASAGGRPGSGGVVSGGGTTSSGGTVSLGGSTSTSDIKIVGSTVQCPGTTAMVPAGTIPSCNITGCTAAHCVPTANIPAGQDTALLAACTGGFCTPDDFIATNAKFLVKTCASLEGAEGRCISTCVPQVNVQLTTLPKDVCAATELCAPCYNPIDGTDTKACSQGCDTGPTKPKVVFDTCGGGLGVCVPPSLVKDPTQLSALKGVDDPTAKCTKTDSSGAAYLCAPKSKAANQSAPFVACTPTSIAAALALANMAGQKGGCVPKYIVPTAQQGLVLQDTCQTGELCAPCTNPLSTPTANAPTGACPWP